MGVAQFRVRHCIGCLCQGLEVGLEMEHQVLTYMAWSDIILHCILGHIYADIWFKDLRVVTPLSVVFESASADTILHVDVSIKPNR